MSYHVDRRGHRPQRRRADPGRRPGGEARGRAQAAADGRGHRRRRDPGDGPPRPHAAVGARHGRVQGAGPARPTPPLALVDDAKALADAGCFAIVLEGVPDEVARMVTDAVDVPTIGIGAGAGCDGQVLVFHDLLGIEDRIAAQVRAPLRRRSRPTRSTAWPPSPPTCGPARFPADDESYHLRRRGRRDPRPLRRRHRTALSQARRPWRPRRRRPRARRRRRALRWLVVVRRRSCSPRRRSAPAVPRASAPTGRRRPVAERHRPRRRSTGFGEVAVRRRRRPTAAVADVLRCCWPTPTPSSGRGA